MCHALVQFYQGHINVEKTVIPLREKYSHIFRDVFVRLASVKCVFYISLQSFMTCGWSAKENLFSFIYYCIIIFNHSPITCAQIYSLTDHSLPNPLLPYRSLHNNNSLIYTFPWLLATQSLGWKHPPRTCFSAVQVSPWLLALSHQPYFVQYCS